jgi:hypothetical protein
MATRPAETSKAYFRKYFFHVAYVAYKDCLLPWVAPDACLPGRKKSHQPSRAVAYDPRIYYETVTRGVPVQIHGQNVIFIPDTFRINHDLSALNLTRKIAT